MKNKTLFTIFLIVFIDLLGFGIILPLLPLIGEKFGANPFILGLLTASYSVFQFISTPILGRLSDKYGRKKILIISQIGSTVGYIMLGFSGNLAFLFASRIIDGITGGNISVAQAYIADVTTKEDRAKGMGLIGAAFGMGFIFGPAIGGLLYNFGFHVPALFAAAVSLIAVIFNIIFLKESVDLRKSQHSPKTSISFSEFIHVIKTFPIGIMITAFFFMNLSFSGSQSNFSIWTEHTFHFNAFQNGLLFTYTGIILIIIQLKILPYLLKNHSEKNILKKAILSMSLGLFIMTLVPNPYLLVFPITFISLGNGLSNPIIQSLSSKSINQNETGGTLGILQSSGSMGRIIGPILGGLAYNQFGKSIPFFSASLLTIGIYILLNKKLK